MGPCLGAPSEQLWHWGMRQPRQAGTEQATASRQTSPPPPAPCCQALPVSIKVRWGWRGQTGTALINEGREGAAPLELELGREWGALGSIPAVQRDSRWLLSWAPPCPDSQPVRSLVGSLPPGHIRQCLETGFLVVTAGVLLASSGGVEARDAAKHPAEPRIAPPRRQRFLLSPVSSGCSGREGEWRCLEDSRGSCLPGVCGALWF